MRIPATVLTIRFAAGLIPRLQEIRAGNSRANNYLPLTGNPLLSRQAHG